MPVISPVGGMVPVDIRPRPAARPPAKAVPLATRNDFVSVPPACGYVNKSGQSLLETLNAGAYANRMSAITPEHPGQPDMTVLLANSPYGAPANAPQTVHSTASTEPAGPRHGIRAVSAYRAMARLGQEADQSSQTSPST